MTVMETNIERVLHDHLWPEIRLLETRINELRVQAVELEERKAMLLRVAEASNINESYVPDPRD